MQTELDVGTTTIDENHFMRRPLRSFTDRSLRSFTEERRKSWWMGRQGLANGVLDGGNTTAVLGQPKMSSRRARFWSASSGQRCSSQCSIGRDILGWYSYHILVVFNARSMAGQAAKAFHYQRTSSQIANATPVSQIRLPNLAPELVGELDGLPVVPVAVTPVETFALVC